MDDEMNIWLASKRGDFEGVRNALCMGADPNKKYRGQTPLMYAAENGHGDITRLLIENGADLEIVDMYNRTALHWSAKNLHLEATKALIENGANTETYSSFGETAMDVCRIRGNIELTRIFYECKPKAIATTVAADESAVDSNSNAQHHAGRPRDTGKELPTNISAVNTTTDTSMTDASPNRGEAVEEEGGARQAEEAPTAASFPRPPPPAEVDEVKQNRSGPKKQ